MEVLALWAVLGIIVAVIANSKQFDVFGWFIYGALTGPIALTHVIIKPRNPAEQPRAIERKKKCPDCAELIKIDAIVCRYCGNKTFPALPDPDPWTVGFNARPRQPQPTTWQKLWWNPHANNRRRS